jgi:D-sedoheptulose 7-phosphate isomerase
MKAAQMHRSIAEILRAGVDLLEATLQDEDMLGRLERASSDIIDAFRAKRKVLICGNGGSAAEAQHMAAELSGKFYLNREPLDAEALHVNSSFLTAVANDYSYDEVFARLVRAKGQKGDVLVAISTSGNSVNVIKALETARAQGLTTVGLTGANPGRFSSLCDHLVIVPSTDTARIQEAQMLIGHALCEIVEHELFAALGGIADKGAGQP